MLFGVPSVRALPACLSARLVFWPRPARSILIGGVDPIRLTVTPKPLPSFSTVAGPSMVPTQVHGLAEDDAQLLGDQVRAAFRLVHRHRREGRAITFLAGRLRTT